MSHHNDSPDVVPQTDITDIYVFQKPGDPSKTILIMNVNPFAPTRASQFNQDASYEWKIDTNADFEAEIAFHIIFRSSGGDQQTATVYKATNAAAQGVGIGGEVIIHDAPVSFDQEVQIATHGEYRFYAGLRSDSWFVDLEGVLNNFQFVAQRDFFAGLNVFGIVLEVPNSDFGPHSQVGVWGRTLVSEHGTFTQVQHAGRSLIQALFNQREAANKFNRTPPSQQRDSFLVSFVSKLQEAGYSESDATKTAKMLLPDILPYDYASSAGFPNGRTLSDDLLDTMLNLITNGKVSADLVGPHTNLLTDFPYLGMPTAAKST